MAKKETNPTNETNKPKVHGVSLVGALLTGGITAAALALPFFGIGGGYLMTIVAGVALGSTVGFSVFRHKKRKAEKLGLAKKDVKKQKVEEVEERNEEVREDLIERINVMEENTNVVKTPKPIYVTANNHDEESVLDSYRVDKIAAKTFAVYEADGLTIKKDAHGEPMIYSIENNKEYRRRLINYVSSEASGDCVIKVLDAAGKADKFDVPATDYSGIMSSVIGRISEVARQTLVTKEPPVMEA